MKWIMFAFAICLQSIPAGAQTPLNTYIGVYVDDSHTSWCVTQTPPYTVEVWFWALPGISGFKGATFDISYPGVEIVSDRVYHPNIAPIGPTKCKPPCPHFSRGYTDCQTDWVWLYHRTIMVTSTEPMTIEIQPFVQWSDVIAYDCAEVEQPAIVLSNCHLNWCGPLPVRSATWGAIKSLYR